MKSNIDRSRHSSAGGRLVGRLHHLWRPPAAHVHPVLRLPQGAGAREAAVAGEGGGTRRLEGGRGRPARPDGAAQLRHEHQR